jgi:hypothetical protein
LYGGNASGAQLRNAISARSNFGLGFAPTHILIKSNDSHCRKSIFDLAVDIICISRLGIDIELMVLSYLGCDAGRYPSSFAFCAFIVFIRGLPALVCLAGAVEAGGSPGSGNPRIKGTEEKESRRELLIANVMVVPL